MKVDIESKVFNPVALKITFESQEEISKFYNLFNFTPFCDYMPVQALQIAEKLRYEEGCVGIGDLEEHLINHPAARRIFGLTLIKE